MARSVEGTLQQAVAAEYNRLLHAVAQETAKEVGDIPGGEKLTPADEDKRWNYRLEGVTPDQYPQIATTITQGLVQQLQQAGQPLPDQPTLTRLVASQMTRVLTKGYRRELVSRGFPLPDAQVKRAEELRRRNEKQAAEQEPQETMTTATAPVEPSAPVAPATEPTPEDDRPAAVRAVAEQAGGGY